MSNTIFEQKLRQIRNLLVEQELDAVRLTMQKNVSWLLDGRSHVNTASEPACCQFVITKQAAFLIVNNIEARRLLEEEIEDSTMKDLIHVHVWPWQDPSRREILVKDLLGFLHASTDTNLEGELLHLRTQIHAEQLEAWRQLGERTADAIEQTAFDLHQGQSEYEIAGLLAKHCWDREIEPIVNLIAVDERSYIRKHPLPTGLRLSNYVMLVICARHKGMIASATRLVHFGKPPEKLDKKHSAVVEIDARLMDSTKSLMSLSEMYAKLQSFYGDAGFPEEYQAHHQGGLTGYASRERLTLPSDPFVVKPRQIYAWNPSIAGVKSEDTILTTHNVPEIITASASGNFPMIQVKVGDNIWNRPAILQR